MRHKYRHTSYHAAASLSFKFVPAPLGVAHDTNATRLTTRTTAPPCPIAHTAHARDGTRGGVRGGLRISVRRRRVVVGEDRGVFWNYPKYSNHPKPKRTLPHRDQRRSIKFGVWAFWTFLVAFFIAMRPLVGPVGASIFLVWGVSVQPSARLLIIRLLATSPGNPPVVAKRQTCWQGKPMSSLVNN